MWEMVNAKNQIQVYFCIVYIDFAEERVHTDDVM